MKKQCVRCGETSNIIKNGKYYRAGDSRKIQRFKCTVCNKRFSNATRQPSYRQKKRRINHPLIMCLASGSSLRRSAKLLKTSYKTVRRRLKYLGKQCQVKLDKEHQKRSKVRNVQFDELQTIEHTKCKPLTVAVAVSVEDRYILGVEVSSMPATGHLVKIAKKKYGFRPDKRKKGLAKLLRKMSPMIEKDAIMTSDCCPFYKNVVMAQFPEANYRQVLGEKGCVAGQGELKKVGKDPLFHINHTLAMFRANINRLFRRTWCTTKDPERLKDHLAIYIWVHNNKLIPQQL